jgi:hypothetical protein
VRCYLGRGYRPMARPLPELLELEPDDVYMRKVIRATAPRGAKESGQFGVVSATHRRRGTAEEVAQNQPGFFAAERSFRACAHAEVPIWQRRDDCAGVR